MIKSILLLFCLLFNLAYHAQWSFKKESPAEELAYVIQNGDTIHGDVSYAKRVFGGHLNIIRFQSLDGEKARYRASDISGFSIHGQVYESAEHEGYRYFFRRAVDGAWPLFYLEQHFHKRSSKQWRAREAGYTDGRDIKVFFHDGQSLQRLYRSNFQTRLKKTIPAIHWTEKDLGQYEWYRVENFFKALND